jgi:hypothetical protein
MNESINTSKDKTRAERRREQRQKNTTYCLTQAQIDMMFQERFKREIAVAKVEATNDAINAAMTLLLTLPLEVLMDHYWQKTYAKRIPEFTNYILKYYQAWQDGELTIEKLQEDLWIYGGVRLEERDVNDEK